MKRTARTLLVALLGSGESVVTLFALTRVAHFDIGDVSGQAYAYAIVPVLSFLVLAIVGAMAFSATRWQGRAIALLLATVALSTAAHVYMLSERLIGGSFYVPASFRPAELTSAELAAAVWSYNDAVQYGAWEELKRRGAAERDALWGVIGEAKRRQGSRYPASYVTQKAASLLAEQRDRRVIPILQAITMSGDVLEENRASAARLAEEHFGVVPSGR